MKKSPFEPFDYDIGFRVRLEKFYVKGFVNIQSIDLYIAYLTARCELHAGLCILLAIISDNSSANTYGAC